MQLGLALLKQSVCGSAAKDKLYKGGHRDVFWQKGLIICAVSLALCLFSSPGEAVSCACFQWDMRTSSLREATGHRPAAAQTEIWSQITSLKPSTQTGTNCVWILSRLNFIVPPNCRETEEVCGQAQERQCLPALCPGKKPDWSVFMWIFVCS